MKYPTLTETAKYTQSVDSFGGLNQNARISENEFAAMHNMCGDHFPVLSVRRRRGIWARPESCQGLIAKDALCWVDGSDFVMDGYHYDLGLSTRPADCPKELVSMGAYVVILPDKKYINTADTSEHGSIEASVTVNGASLTLCREDGTALNVNSHGPEPPEEPTDGWLWMDTSGDAPALMQWSALDGIWVNINTVYVRLEAPNLGKPFKPYDGVTVSGLEGNPDKQVAAISGNLIVWNAGDDFLVFGGIVADPAELTEMITIERRMPDMDFVIESGNRLWGCRYGLSRTGETVNEIYASKLGDFKNWTCFMGTSTDSYAVSLGSDGQFTGAVNHRGYPIFFKADWMHKIYGSFPAQYQVQSTACRGVQKGSSKSLAAVNEVLYYKGRTGICAYDGSTPVEVSQALGGVSYGHAVGGGHGNKYYVSMEDGGGRRHLFVYDVRQGLWHEEDDISPLCFCSARDDLFFIDQADGAIKTVLGSGEEEELPFRWAAVSGPLGLQNSSGGYVAASGEAKRISQISLRLSMDAGAEMTVSIRYDSMGTWHELVHLKCRELRSYCLPIRPRRCDHFQLRLEGTGGVKLFSLIKTIEGGSGKTDSDGQYLDF